MARNYNKKRRHRIKTYLNEFVKEYNARGGNMKQKPTTLIPEPEEPELEEITETQFNLLMQENLNCSYDEIAALNRHIQNIYRTYQKIQHYSPEYHIRYYLSPTGDLQYQAEVKKPAGFQ